MVTALASLATGRPVRSEVGMTGEVTLNGRVLPIGGLKQKLLAAQRDGLTEVFVPLRNEPDLDDVPTEVLEALTVHVVGDVLDVVRRRAGRRGCCRHHRCLTTRPGREAPPSSWRRGFLMRWSRGVCGFGTQVRKTLFREPAIGHAPTLAKISTPRPAPTSRRAEECPRGGRTISESSCRVKPRQRKVALSWGERPASAGMVGA